MEHSSKRGKLLFLLHFSVRVFDLHRELLFAQQFVRPTCALYGICTQQHFPDGLFKKQCYSISASGIVGFPAYVLVKLGISVETSESKVLSCGPCQINIGELKYCYKMKV